MSDYRTSNGFGGGPGQRAGLRNGDGDDELRFLGPKPEQSIRALRLYFEIGREFSRGAGSLRAVAERLDARSLRRELPGGLPSTLSSVQRATRDAKLIFGRHFHGAGEADLFICQGKGLSASGLSDLGTRAWKLTGAFLITHGIIGEID